MEVDAIIVGAGVIGLAVARALAQAGHEVIVLERNRMIGAETSARNSEVIHAGIYYPRSSLKAELCVRGRSQLLDYCADHNVPFNLCGKIIVALTENQEQGLEVFAKRGTENGVENLAPLTQNQLAELEPELEGRAGLWSPSTGILDTHTYLQALLGDLEDGGGRVAFNAKFHQAQIEPDGFTIHVETDGENYPLKTRMLINAAGLWARDIALSIDGLSSALVPEIHFAKGSYFSYSGRVPFKRLVYPVPDPGGLGVHLTLDLAGQARFGPDVEWLTNSNPNEIDYQVNPKHQDQFYQYIKTYWPGIDLNKLAPGFSGVRPKVVGSGEKPGDFSIRGPSVHGVEGLVNLFGIESPGLTSSLAIGDQVRKELKS